MPARHGLVELISRVRRWDAAQQIRDKGQQHLPGEEAWLIGEHRSSGEKKYYLANLPAKADLRTLAATIKARWVCEQAHQQLKGELGLVSRVLHYNPGRGDLVGGNFWDMRATGRRLGNPAAEQAEGPPTNPVEMGLPGRLGPPMLFLGKSPRTHRKSVAWRVIVGARRVTTVESGRDSSSAEN